MTYLCPPPLAGEVARRAGDGVFLFCLGRAFGAHSGTKPLIDDGRAFCRVKSRFLAEICRGAARSGLV
jgi:hypothetical protein